MIARRRPRHHPVLRAALVAVAVGACALVAAPLAGATVLPGMESNGELANSDRTPALQAAALDKMQAQGVRVVRVNFGWNEIAGNCAGRSAAALRNPLNACYDWSRLDSLVRLTRVRGQVLLLSTSRVPQWVLRSSDVAFMGRTSASFQRVVTHYSAFIGAAGTRYRTGSPFGTIPYWTILNEPNSADFWKPAPDPKRYALIYARAAVALKTAHPGARIAPGPTGPNSKAIKPVPFIRAFLRHAPGYLPGSMANKRRYLNAWAHNPYPGYNNQPSVATPGGNPDSIGMARIQRLFTELDRSPLTRGVKVWATEFGWETSGPASTSTKRQAQFVAEAFDWLAATNRVTIGISYGLTDAKALGDFQSGTYFADGRAKPSQRMFQRMVSVPAVGNDDAVPHGTTVAVWGRSNVAPTSGQLAFRARGDIWRLVPGQRRYADGSIRANLRITASTVDVAVYDGMTAFPGDTGYGPTRRFSTY